MTGYRAFSFEFVKTFPVISKGFEIETEMTIHAIDKNMQIENVIIEYRDRPEGSESKLNTIPDGIKVIKTILNLYKNYKPFTFFGLISLFMTLLSVGFFIPVFNEYLQTGLVPKFPTLIVCGVVLMLAALFFIAGIILSTLRAKDRNDFEFKLNIVNSYKKNLE